ESFFVVPDFFLRLDIVGYSWPFCLLYPKKSRFIPLFDYLIARHLPNLSLLVGAEVWIGCKTWGFILIRHNGSIIYLQPDNILVKIRLIDD
ncbi:MULTISPECIES: hypothetical protein, partial [unclassified Moorena]|uniref:hypothetical protein n=1 Tax=unclassified Moorena TaxID=2683338 RepID=UPI0025795D08